MDSKRKRRLSEIDRSMLGMVLGGVDDSDRVPRPDPGPSIPRPTGSGSGSGGGGGSGGNNNPNNQGRA